MAGTGLLVEQDPALFAKAVDSVIGDPDLQRDLADRSYQRAQLFPWTTLLGTLEHLYEDVAEGR